MFLLHSSPRQTRALGLARHGRYTQIHVTLLPVAVSNSSYSQLISQLSGVRTFLPVLRWGDHPAICTERRDYTIFNDPSQGHRLRVGVERLID